MIKKYLIFIFWAATVAVLVLVSRTYKDSTSAILAQVEPQRYAISFQKPIKVREIYVMPGQRINKGDPLIKVERPDLLLDAERKENTLKSLNAKLAIKKIERDNRISLARLNHDQRLSKVNTEIEQLNIVMTNNENLSKNLSSLNLLPDSVSNPDQSYMDLRMKLLMDEKEGMEIKYKLELEEIAQVYNLETETLLNEIKETEQEIALLNQEENELVQYAHINGTIGNVYSEDEELVPPYTTLISVYEENPTIIRALMNEHQSYEIKSGDNVIVESTNRKYRIEGTVSEVGSRIIEYPNRLRSHRDIPSYGRELFIKIPDESNFLNGEKVFVIVNK